MYERNRAERDVLARKEEAERRKTQRREARVEQAEPALRPGEADAEEHPESRQEFAGLYRRLRRDGAVPDARSGALRVPDHPALELMPNGDLYGPHRELTAYLKSEQFSRKRGSEIIGVEAHHLLEDRLMQPFGFSQGEGLCVAIYADEHMEAVHGETGVDFQLPHGYRYDIWDVVDGHARAYREMGRPEWAAKVQDYVRANRERILRAYGEGTVPWATPEDVKQARAYLNSL